MKLLTAMNYDWRRSSASVAMCVRWFDSLFLHNPGADVTVLTAGRIPEELKTKFSAKRKVEFSFAFKWDTFRHKNISVKLNNICRMRVPFIWLDADMEFLGPLQPLIDRMGAKPLIAVDQHPDSNDLERPRFLNSGLLLVSDPWFLDFSRVSAAPKGDFDPPGNDQRLLYRYFKQIGYDWTHPDVGVEWNWWGGLPPKPETRIAHYHGRIKHCLTTPPKNQT